MRTFVRPVFLLLAIVLGALVLVVPVGAQDDTGNSPVVLETMVYEHCAWILPDGSTLEDGRCERTTLSNGYVTVTKGEDYGWNFTTTVNERSTAVTGPSGRINATSH